MAPVTGLGDGARGDPLVEFRRRLRASEIHQYRFLDGTEVAWEESPAGTDASLQRFLRARKGDYEKAEKMFVSHLLWRRRVFPIVRSGCVAEILADGRRLGSIGMNSDGLPVLLINFLWGYFLEERASALDCLRAVLVFMEEEITIAEAKEVHQAIVVSYGGPPPLDFCAALVAILEANYPERLYRGIIYPVPRMVTRFVRAMLWFVDEGTRRKLQIEWNEEAFLKLAGLRQEQLPEVLCGGLAGAERQMKPDSKSRMNSLLRAGITGGRGSALRLQQQLEALPGLPLAVRRPPSARAPEEEPRAAPGLSRWLCCCITRESAGSFPPSGGFGAGAASSAQARPRSPAAAAAAVSSTAPQPSDGANAGASSGQGHLCRTFAVLLLFFTCLLFNFAPTWRREDGLVVHSGIFRQLHSESPWLVSAALATAGTLALGGTTRTMA